MADDSLECRASKHIDDHDISLDQLRKWMPENRDNAVSPGTFEIGLVLAGATSAGAYTAGVMDFLFEALDAWQDARDRGEPVPNHKAVIQIITGASAGGINGAIAAAACRHEFPAVHSGTQNAVGSKNPFYGSWVEQVDIVPLLDTDDLADGGLKSILNCNLLTKVALGTVSFQGAGTRTRDWLANPLPLVLTVSNLQGVAYRVRFEGATDFDHEMITHRDEMAFAVPVGETAPAKALSPAYAPLTNPNSALKPDWKLLAYSALATSAFPIALAPRLLCRPFSDYEYRFVYPYYGNTLVYSKPHGGGPDRYDFATVDGGALNNEPFQIAHTALAGSNGQNPRAGNEANRAILLVDPFTDPRIQIAPPSTALGQVAKRLLGMFMDQPRFEQIDLTLALAGDVYSRFMIAPARPGAKGTAALASGGLGTFLGFLCRDYRHHDYMLGRANCQAFLRDWFVLPSKRAVAGAPPVAGDNPLFDSWPQAALNDPAYKSNSPHNPDHRQIIPLVTKVRDVDPAPIWPKNKFAGFVAIEDKIKARLDAAYPYLRDSLLGGIKNSIGRWAAKRAADSVWGLYGRGAIMDTARTAIDEAVKDVNDRSFT